MLEQLINKEFQGRAGRPMRRQALKRWQNYRSRRRGSAQAVNEIMYEENKRMGGREATDRLQETVESWSARVLLRDPHRAMHSKQLLSIAQSAGGGSRGEEKNKKETGKKGGQQK